MLVYIFVAILRSLGIPCRLVLSFQVEPLRPPDNELISLSTKSNKSTAGHNKRKAEMKISTNESENDSSLDKTESQKKPENKKIRSKSTSEISQVKEEIRKSRTNSTSQAKTANNKKTRSKKESESFEHGVEEVKKTRSKSTRESVQSNERKRSVRSLSSSSKVKSKVKLEPPKNTPETTRTLRSSNRKTVPQVDGANDSNSDEEMILQVDGADNEESQQKQTSRRHSNRLDSKVLKYKETDSEDEFTTRSPFVDKNVNTPQTKGNINLKKSKNVPQKTAKTALATKTSQRKLVDKKLENGHNDVDEERKTPKKRRSGNGYEEDSDYIPEASKNKKRRESEDDFVPKTKITRKIQAKRNNSNEEKMKIKQGTDIWVEVFIENEKKWITIDVFKGQVNCVNELYTRATQPVSYIITWNNKDFVKDVTARYCQNFNTVTRKLRVDPTWWGETLCPFLGPKTKRDKEEDEEIEKEQLAKPLPKSIAEYKNHPLYALRRHLLKFEAIYPPDAPTLGFVRNEPVYSRQCVYTLHSRDIWLKKAKVVKLGEEPYKIVKRPRYDRLTNTIVTDQPLDIFGLWQTEDYVPPTAENGVVPRNAFGNVDLFQPSMLPKKTVHLKLSGLNKVAKRMNIDCASAIVGFDFHGGWCHPIYDGFVVCEEFADVLAAAWELEQDELDKKEQEKIDKRVYGNWRRIIRGLLIRERLKAKYEFGEVSEEKDKKKNKGVIKLAIKRKKTEDTSESE